MPMQNPMRYGSTPPGSTGQVAYNNAGAWGGASALYWDETNGRLGVGVAAPGQRVDIAGGIKFSYVNAPGAATIALGAGGSLNTAGVHSVKVTFVSPNGETELGTASGNVTVTGAGEAIELTAIPVSTDPTVTGRNIWMTKAGGAAWYRIAASPVIANNTATTLSISVADASLLFNGTSNVNTTGGALWSGTEKIFSIASSGSSIWRGPNGAAEFPIGANTQIIALGTGGLSIVSSGGSARAAFSDAGYLVFYTAGARVGIGTGSPTSDLSFGGNAARKIWLERHTTADTAGNNLTFQAGGCTASATNKNGGVLTLVPGTTTGAGMASVRIHRALRSAAATTDNAYADAIVVPSEFPLTDEAANSLFEVALPTLTNFCGHIVFGITAGDGTDVQAYSGTVDIASQNKGGVFTSSIVESTATYKASSAATLTTAWGVTAGANKITISVTPTSSLVPTSMKIYYTLISNSAQTVTQL